MKGRQGPSPLLYRCRYCGRRLEYGSLAVFAVCSICNRDRPGATLVGRGGLTVVFHGHGELSSKRLDHPNDGAYGLSD